LFLLHKKESSPEIQVFAQLSCSSIPMKQSIGERTRGNTGIVRLFPAPVAPRFSAPVFMIPFFLVPFRAQARFSNMTFSKDCIQQRLRSTKTASNKDCIQQRLRSTKTGQTIS